VNKPTKSRFEGKERCLHCTGGQLQPRQKNKRIDKQKMGLERKREGKKMGRSQTTQKEEIGEE
jgi:hypothetical protein